VRNLNEYINESLIGAGLTAIVIGTGVISYAIPTLLNFTLGNDVVPYPHKLVVDWYNDKKVAKIIDRLKKDEDVMTFFKQPRYKQQRGWRDLIKAKLSDCEIKYIAEITKTKFE
jgi:hypothetical protein